MNTERHLQFRQNRPEMKIQGTEENLTMLYDSDSSNGSYKSPAISPQNSSLTLEQFTDIVLAQEKIDNNSDNEYPVTVHESVDKSSDSNRRHIILPLAKTTTFQSYSQLKPTQSGEKLKAVVLTPRQVDAPKLASPPHSLNNRLTPRTLQVVQNNPQCNTSSQSRGPKILPLYESHSSIVGSLRGLHNSPGLFPGELLQNNMPERGINQHNEVHENEDRVGKIESKSHPSLSVRKDLVKISTSYPKINDKEKGKDEFQARPKDLKAVITKLMANARGDLIITKRAKKDGPKVNVYNNQPPEVKLTPIYKHTDNSQNKRKTQHIETHVEESPKKLKISSVESDNKPKFLNSLNIKKENSSIMNKIAVDCKIALQPDLHENFPLHNAVLLSNINLVKRFSLVLAACQKSVDLVNGDGLTPLHLAVEQNTPALVDELLHYGASPLASTSTGDTCYHLAARHRDAGCLGLVLRHGRDRPCLDIANDQGQTALHLTVMSGQHAMVKMLLAHGARPDTQELTSGKTGLFLAIEQGDEDIVELLLSYGASVTIPSYGGVTPLTIGTENRKIMGMIFQNKVGN